ncbi:hypothetical protein DIPPA_12128 [Diplonema papillatum]|nr:hypothetical protein DIPPA_12128 [Diplonema papillatum]
MSKTGKVVSWRGPYGFAELEDGRAVYIHTDEIDGGRLRIGLSVKFDTQDVEGHEGKLKGTNVSGEAVQAKGAKLSEEEIAADKKRIEEMNDENKKEFDVVFKEVERLNRSNKVHMLKTLLKELNVGELKARELKRPDPTERGSKRLYSKGEFTAFYGAAHGNRMWALAGRKGRGGGRKPFAKKEEAKEEA